MKKIFLVVMSVALTHCGGKLPGKQGHESSPPEAPHSKLDDLEQNPAEEETCEWKLSENLSLKETAQNAFAMKLRCSLSEASILGSLVD